VNTCLTNSRPLARMMIALNTGKIHSLHFYFILILEVFNDYTSDRYDDDLPDGQLEQLQFGGRTHGRSTTALRGQRG